MPIFGGAAGSSQLVLLSDQTVAAAATVDFTSIANYPAYWLMWVSTSAVDDTVTMKINNDGGAKYSWGQLKSAGATVTGSATVNYTTGAIGIMSSNFHGECLFLNAGAAITKRWVSKAGSDNGTYTTSGYYNDTAAVISRITIIAPTGAFTGRFILYGLKV